MVEYLPSRPCHKNPGVSKGYAPVLSEGISQAELKVFFGVTCSRRVF